MKHKLVLAICLAGWSWLAFNIKQHENAVLTKNSITPDEKPRQFAEPVIAEQQLASLKKFADFNNYNNEVCFLIKMSLPSGSKRFFSYDLRKDSVRNSGLVTHGNCYQYWLEGRRYSNKPGSGCTSLGKYKIGKSYYGKFGLAYKLYGLDDTNNKAFERFVVMHAHACVPDKETKNDICQSNGCPTVSPAFLDKLQTIIDKSPRPVLLYIYE